MLRIALICEYFHPDNSGGTPTDMSELAHHLKQRYGEDIQIDVLTSQNLYRPSGNLRDLSPREDWDGVNIRRFRTPKSNRPSMALRLAAGGVFSLTVLFYLLTHRSYDLLVIVTNPPANGMIAWVYSRLRRVPYVYVINDLYPDIAVALGKLRSESFITKFFSKFQRQWLNAANRLVVVGRCMQQHLHSRYGVPKSNIVVIRNWADPVQISPAAKENAFRRANQLSGFIVLYGGNFSQYVNFDQMLGAAKLLKPNPNISFVLIGDGARRAEIVERVAQEKLENVRVLPPVPRSAMNEVLAASDLCLISLDPRMRGLGTPGKLYSIMASGRPIMAMVPAGSEVGLVIKEEQCGIEVSDGDVTGLAREISQLQANPALVEEMGRKARAALEKRFTLSQAAEQFHAVFQEAS